MPKLDEVMPAVYRFMLGADEKDADAMAAQVTEDFSALIYLDGQLLNETRGRAAMVEQMSAFFPVQQDVRRHAVTNAFIEEGTDDEVVICSLLAAHVVEAGRAELRATGLYHDRLVRRGRDWKLHERILHLDCPTDAGAEPPTWATLGASGDAAR